MITFLTQVLIVLQIVLSVGLYMLLRDLFLVGSIPLAWILSFGIVLWIRFMLIANTFFIAYRHRTPLPAKQQLALKAALRLLLQEFCASMLVTSWHMPFRSFSGAIASQVIGLPVLLIHGYGCNSGYWQCMRRRLVQRHISHKAVDLEPLLGGIDDYLAGVDQAVETLCKATGQEQIIILAHSMGGLVARAYLRKCSGRRIAKIITVGTPHHGTVLANFSIGINSLQMRWCGDAEHGQPSEWLRNLAGSEDAASRALITSIYSLHDNIVAPQRSCHLPGAKNIAIPGIGHVALGLHPAVQALALEEIKLAAEHG
ncbi:MAG: alpha/beta fold hydrolase [Glaciimonas sp.]|nr:alpha/beta fold hydrolase [Glaciimonas sp.]